MLPSFREKTAWTPTNEPAPRRSWQQWTLITTAVIAVWVVALVLTLTGQEDGETLVSAGDSARSSNLVRIANDLSQPVYFVPCGDTSCNELTSGNSPGDFNLVTPTNSQEIRLSRAKERTVTVGVYDDDRTQRGCVQLQAETKRRPLLELALSDVLSPCGGRNEATTSTTSSTSSTTTVPRSTTSTTVDSRSHESLDEA